MVRQLQLICVASITALATGCCSVPGPAYSPCSPCPPYGGCPLPLPLPVPTIVPLPLPLPVPVLSGAHVACALNTPICGGMDCCTDACCSAPGGTCGFGPAPCGAAPSCGDSCGEGHYGYGAPVPAQPAYPDSYSPMHTPEVYPPAPAQTPSPVPVPQDSLPETSTDASAFDATGIRRTTWEFSQAEMNSRVQIPGQRVSNREMRVQHVVGSPNAVSVLHVPAQ